MVKGKVLRRERQRRKFTLMALAAKTGVDFRTISSIEHGRTLRPAYDTVVLLATALEVEPSALWSVSLPRAS